MGSLFIVFGLPDRTIRSLSSFQIFQGKRALEDMNYPDVLTMAMSLEEKASKFYSDAAERSESLLATIPSAFRRVGECRNSRKGRMDLLLENLKR